ncbi:MAG: hypothetical protein IPK52_00225 [Chloroflexi bacterium]|nr:hypothetical protein [Chloroflexota bacterium]
MPSPYYITPFDPSEWNEDTTPIEKTSNLRVDGKDLVSKANLRFPNFVAISPTSWYFEHELDRGASGILYGPGNQILKLEYGEGLEDFILWYRSYILSDYKLFLFIEGADKGFPLTSETTFQSLRQFIGVKRWD